MINKIAHVIKQITTGEKVVPELAQKRLAICLNCKELFRLTGNCKKCGCFVREKVKYKTERCPLGKWY